MSRELLEKYQVLVYLAAVALGLLLGALAPGRVGWLEPSLWPLLALLLYATFTQVPLTDVRAAFADTEEPLNLSGGASTNQDGLSADQAREGSIRASESGHVPDSRCSNTSGDGLVRTFPKFLAAVVLGNFVLIPLLVWGLLWLVPDDPAIRLGVLLVLLVPCTDWFITFSHLGGGDSRYAVAFSPVSLLLQILLLPLYLWLFLGEGFAVAVAQREMLIVFVAVILLPLLAAWWTRRWVGRQPARRAKAIDRLGWWPVPLLGVVVLVIAATQVNTVAGHVGVLLPLLPVFVGYLVVAALLAAVLGKVFRLPAAQSRVVAFSLGTRNSFVVLPLALALPATYELAVVAIVFQSLVELIGMAVYLWWIPGWLFPEGTGGS